MMVPLAGVTEESSVEASGALAFDPMDIINFMSGKNWL